MTSPGPMILMPALSRPRSTNCLTKVPPWPEGTNTKIASGLCVGGALQERREIRDSPAGSVIASITWPPFGGEFAPRRISPRRRRARNRTPCVTTFLMPFCAAQSAIGTRRLRQREARARDVGRLLGDDRGAGRGDDLRHLGFGRERRDRERRRRDAEAGEEVHLVVDDQVLRDALGVVGNGAVILDDEFDLLAGDGVAVLRHEELDGGGFLLAGRLLLAGHRQDEADLDAVAACAPAPPRRRVAAQVAARKMRRFTGFLPRFGRHTNIPAVLSSSGMSHPRPPISANVLEFAGKQGRSRGEVKWPKSCSGSARSHTPMLLASDETLAAL